MERISCISVIHCGVVGNIQAFHVCAPGSIPGDGIFCILEKRREKREGVYFYIEEEKNEWMKKRRNRERKK